MVSSEAQSVEFALKGPETAATPRTAWIITSSIIADGAPESGSWRGDLEKFSTKNLVNQKRKSRAISQVRTRSLAFYLSLR